MEFILESVVAQASSSSPYEEWMIFVAYGAIIFMAMFPIYLGSHLSLKDKTVGPTGKREVDTLSSKDAYMVPVIGSCVLFGLYVLFKYFSKEYVNLLLTGYFLIFGVLAVASSFEPIIGKFLPQSWSTQKPHKVSIPIPFRAPFEFEWRGLDIVSLIFGIAVGVWWVATKHWISNNIIGLCFSVQGVAYLSLGSYQVGCVLLGGLFFYDVFWVFGTDVMVTVAKSFDAPIKLLWPKDLFAEELQYSMLGLGDIVIPGIFVALMLRFDEKRARGRKNFKKPFFTFTFIGYFLGMATTIFIMHTFKAAQPALLYLVPYCIGSSLLCGALLGQLREVVMYSEEIKEGKSGSKRGKRSKKSSKNKQ
eukprot:CAMPEP_0174260732 /NCGR_PEP_ID=MMETSP0439-20130205/10404_1 /TAXON_ID=0 /ORGANISM="Stereomyxa ramosa, Strain Chinc5" /LENGTH=361 /DNA_ID=CAMNT_0015345045 /DNA_START=37 /DNA_END=1122 /DNA_ORIENTATION=+